MRDHVHGPPAPRIDEYSPTAAPLVPPPDPPPDHATEAATGVPLRVDESVDALVGSVLVERYRIDRRLGAGGMGAVYAGFHLALDRRVALKVIQPRLGADATIAQRFVQEARAASAIGHEHIVQITDFGRTADGAAFLVMEYLDGEDLAETLRREGPLPWHRVAHIGEQIAWALAAAHRQGIVHRDIKPANCYRVPREQDPDFIKVLDFGLAKLLVEGGREGESLTGTGMLLGTPGYIAPELYRGLKADHRVDIYALGALMHKLLTGELPSMAGGSGAIDSLRGVNAPGAVLAVLGRALAEAPDDRYTAASDLAQALRAIPRVSVDEPTQLGQGSVDSTLARKDPSSAQAITLREQTPASFPSLFTVERDGQRVRYHVGAPLIVLLLAGIGLLVWWLTRPIPFLGDSLQRTRNTVISAKAARIDAPPAPVAAPPAPVAAPPPAPALVAAPPPAPAPGEPPVPEDMPPKPAEPAPTPPAPGEQPVPEDMPPEPAAPDKPPVPEDMSKKPTEPAPAGQPAKKRLKGHPDALRNYLSRKCFEGLTLSRRVELRWDTDADGLLIPRTVASVEPDDHEITRCALKELRRSNFQWRPSTSYSEKLKLGGSP